MYTIDQCSNVILFSNVIVSRAACWNRGLRATCTIDSCSNVILFSNVIVSRAACWNHFQPLFFKDSWHPLLYQIALSRKGVMFNNSKHSAHRCNIETKHLTYIMCNMYTIDWCSNVIVSRQFEITVHVNCPYKKWGVSLCFNKLPLTLSH